MRGLVIVTAGIVAIGATLAGPVLLGASPAAGTDVRSIAHWSMVPQSKDTNDDGIIDGDGGVPRHDALGLSPSPVFEGAGNHIAQPNERLIG